ncbi:MAG: hypothetical protein ABIH58_05385 [Patescibacteria group bacterium]
MTTKKLKSTFSIFILLSLVGCAFTHEVSINPVRELSRKEKIPLRITLQLSPELCAYTLTKNRMGDQHIFPLGGPLCKGSEIVARAACTEVFIISKDSVASEQKIDARLIPEIITVDYHMPQWAWEEQEAVIIVKWTLFDNAGKVLWIDTIQSKGSNKLGSTFSGLKRNRETMQMAVDDLFQKSLESILSSQEIRRFAVSVAK